ncbi:bifunctional DNA primase/polymerase [Gloeocapsopsis crepidinum LEGE 06123]|uniref:Bifunctional DNA primase/polymerase n=1 Tax=Gloeocapsopsis crepidinum LEGE 06123 TaxID=588587 RepID=A0ABR9UQT0_9CHRO|nr:bifunctional DNA primase/polymerase [Gloeocapsopsis crepidinum]MBE9190639.1 bifunctional DNA primase/polymerase [Gloeocapsopsis crepidinum LEGE 06123]
MGREVLSGLPFRSATNKTADISTTTTHISKISMEPLKKQLVELPNFWALTPIKEDKRPYLDNWNHHPQTKEQILEEIDNPLSPIKAVGVLLGEYSDGLVCVDHDGQSATELINKLAGTDLISDALPQTVTVTSGRPGRYSCFYRVPQEYWGSIRTKKVKTGVVDELGKIEQVEFRWNGCQSVVIGEHPVTGSYYWIHSSAFTEIAEAPLWVIEQMLIPQKAVNSEARKPLKPYSASKDRQRILDALYSLKSDRADDYEEWKNIGMALHSTGDDSLLWEWDKWSQQSSKYEDGECVKKWNSFNGSGINIGSLFYMAQQDGFVEAVNLDDDSAAFRKDLERIEQAEDFEEQVRLKAKFCSTHRVGKAELQSLLEHRAEKRETEKNGLEIDIDVLLQDGGEDYVVPGLVPKGAVVILAGKPKSGKSIAGIDLMYAMATKRQWLGFDVEPGRTLFFSTERTKWNAVHLLKRFHGDKELIKKYVTILPKFSVDILKKYLATGLYKNVVIDSLTSVNAGKAISENDKAYADIFYAIDPIIEKANVGCMVIHHPNKNPQATGVDQLRGSGAISGAIWGLLILKRPMTKDPKDKRKWVEDESTNTRELQLTGLQSVEGTTYELELNTEDNSFTNLGELRLSEAERREQAEMANRIIKVLQDNSHCGGLLGVELKELLGITSDSEYKYMSKLLNKLPNIKKNRTGKDVRYSLHCLRVEITIDGTQTHTEKDFQSIVVINTYDNKTPKNGTENSNVSDATLENQNIITIVQNPDREGVSAHQSYCGEKIEGGSVPSVFVAGKTFSVGETTKIQTGDTKLSGKRARIISFAKEVDTPVVARVELMENQELVSIPAELLTKVFT